MADVVIQDLVKVYPQKGGPGVCAVNKVNLSVGDGEFMVLVGPSGCGKSTTLRMIAGLEEISGGTVSIDGKVVNEVRPKDRDIAMVFQNYALYPHMSVRENMAFGLKLRGFPKAEIAARVEEAAAMLGLEACLSRKPKELSGGQRQRVALGRAIVRKPKVFLFDEPLSNLDARMRVSTRTELTRLHARLKATMIYVTHDQVEAMTMGDRICVMKDGNVMQVAEPLALYNEPANLFVAGFIGSPPMNFLKGTLATAGDRSEFVGDNAKESALRIALDAPLSASAAGQVNKPIVLGVRPEDVHIGDSPGSFKATIDFIEPMGAETFLHFVSAGQELIARVRPEGRFVSGQIVDLRLDLTKARLFDPVTGAVLK